MPSTKNQIENIKTFLKYWATVPDENIPVDLKGWRERSKESSKPASDYTWPAHNCNTIACAGGWLSAMPEFAAMGIVPDYKGAPILPAEGNLGYCPSYVSRFLFGSGNLFLARLSGREKRDLTDKEIVTKRFTEQLAFLEATSANARMYL